MRDAEIDIVVDLMGYTGRMRTGIFAMRPCPVQVNFLGFPGTMGADFVDYLIADETVIPRHEQGNFSEAVVYLPNSYQPNDRRRVISDRAVTRAECGLPEAGFVFCCFNSNYKITPALFGLWMRIPIMNYVRLFSVLLLFLSAVVRAQSLRAAQPSAFPRRDATASC